MKGYHELNDVIAAEQVLGGTKVWSSWIEGYTWARKLIVRVSGTQPFDILVQRRSADGLLGQEIVLNSIAEAPSAGFMVETDYDFAVTKSFHIAVRNSGGDFGDFKLSLVLIG